MVWKGTRSGSQASRVVLRFNQHLKVLEMVPMIGHVAHGTPRQPILSSNIAAHANGSCLLGFHPFLLLFNLTGNAFTRQVHCSAMSCESFNVNLGPLSRSKPGRQSPGSDGHGPQERVHDCQSSFAPAH